MNSQRPSPSTTLPCWAYLALWLLAAVPRLVLAVDYFHHPIALDDMFQYDMLARSITDGNGYRWYRAQDFERLKAYYDQFLDMEKMSVPEEGIKTAHRAPGYPVFLSGIYALAPEESRFGWTRLVQAALTASLAPLAAFIAIHSGLGKKSAVLAGSVMAVYPILLFYPLALASENLFIPALTLAFALLVTLRQKPHWSVLVVSSLSLWISTLTRSIIALFILVSALWMHWVQRIKPVQIVVFITIALGLCLPWAVRNSQMMGKPTFLETSLGYNLFISYHPEGNGGFISDIAIQPLTYLRDQARERYTMDKALQFIRQDPLDAIIRIFRKAAFFFGVEDREMIYFYGNGFFGEIPQPWRFILYVGLITPWILILFLAPAGMMDKYPDSAVTLTAGLMLSYTFPHLLIIAEPRFHLALAPMLLPYAAYAWVRRRRMIHRLTAPDQQRKIFLLILIWMIVLGLLVWNFSLHWETLVQIMGPDGHQLPLSY